MKNYLQNYHLNIFRGYDDNGNPFICLILANQEESNELNDTSCKESIDLTKYNVIYKHPGLNISKKIIKEAIDYLKNTYIPELEKQKKEQQESLSSGTKNHEKESPTEDEVNPPSQISWEGRSQDCSNETDNNHESNLLGEMSLQEVC